jgi:integrase/recombinase XerD
LDNEGIIEEFLSMLQLRGCSLNTVNGYRLDLNQFFKAINKQYDEIDFKEVNSYFRLMVNKKSIRTIARKMASVRSFYTWCVDEDYMKEDPSRKLKSPKMPKRIPKYLTEDEIEQLINAMNSFRDKTVVVFLYTTGLRISEMYALNKDDMDWQTKTVKVLGKGNKERIVPFNERAKNMLLEYIATRDDDNPALFVEKNNLRLSKRSIQKSVKSAGIRAGIKKPVTPHKMRHSYGSHLIQEGVQLQTVSNLMGHSSTNVTEIYAWLSKKQVIDAYSSVFDKEEND